MTDEPGERRRRGEKTWKEVMVKTPPAAATPYKAAGILDFVFSEMWSRPGLTRKERRWITLACVSSVGQPGPIRSHLRAALESGDIEADELREFVLHFAVYCGWPAASTVEAILGELEEELGSGA
ncbi:MAG TPA: carboxymuconolactone decarboxylase family protein [Acidimicrobiales bacterium]|jgi:4-carboxymuconolactone decarboxylase|nr:carboxymuconolactone decarboxylase family protein [Acidimicrobiales bacterium]